MTTIAETYRLLRGAGFAPDKAAVMTAIAIGESGLRPGAVGDTSLADATWGPSVGLFQVRTLRAQTGTGGSRDVRALEGSTAAQARAAFEISGGGRRFEPWSVFTSGAYLKHLETVRRTIGDGALVAPAPAGGSAGGLGVGLPNPLGGLLGLGGDLAGDATASVTKGLAKLTITGTALAAGLVLVVLGLYRGVAPRIEQARSDARGVAAVVATRGASSGAKAGAA